MADSTIMVALVNVGRPYSQAVFKRWKAAVPNMAGFAFGKEVPSFRAPYFVDESSDMVELDEEITARFFDELAKQGYSNIRVV